MNPLSALPPLRLTVNASSVSTVTMQALLEVQVRQALSAPSLCELVFAGPAAKLRSDQLLPGSSLTLDTGEGEPLFTGQITALDYIYAPDSGQQLRVRAYDALHSLRKRQPVRVHVEVTLADLARELTADLGVEVRQEQASPLWKRVFQHRQSDLELLVDLAGRCGQYLALRGETLHLLTLEGSGDAVSLKLGDSLFEARVEVSGEPACSSVMASGWSATRLEGFRGLALDPRLGRDPRGAVPPQDLGSDGARTLTDEGAQDNDHALGLAQAELDLRCAREVSLWGIAEGNSLLRPGVPVEVAGLDAQLPDRYVLASVLHTIDRRKGYVSEFSTLPPAPRVRAKAAMASPGVVSRVDDPEGLGRVKVKLTSYENLETDWMGVLSPGAGGKKGFIMIPDVNDQVLVLFAHEDPGQGVVLGGMFGVNAPPDAGVEGGAVRRFTLLTPGGQRIRLDDGRNAIHIEDSTGSYMEFSPEQVRLHCKVGMTLEAPGLPIVIQGKSIDFKEA